MSETTEKYQNSTKISSWGISGRTIDLLTYLLSYAIIISIIRVLQLYLSAEEQKRGGCNSKKYI
jgi:hypothetical protein